MDHRNYFIRLEAYLGHYSPEFFDAMWADAQDARITSLFGC